MNLRTHDDEAIARLRESYSAQPWARVVVPDVIDEKIAAELRSRAAAQVRPFCVADRGRYHTGAASVDGALFEALRALAERVAGRPLVLAAAFWWRFAHGDYQLLRGDAVARLSPARHIELTLDFSSVETGQAEIVYTDGRESFFIPQIPLSAALVQRVDALYRYERYLNHHVGEAEVWRLRLSLVPAGAAAE